MHNGLGSGQSLVIASGVPMRALVLVSLGLVGGSFAPLGAVAGPWFEAPQSRVRLVSAWSVAAPASEARLGLEFELAPGWHVYWKNPGDAGFPPRIDFTPGSGLTETCLRFPAPSRFELAGDLVAIGYTGSVIYPVEARLDATPAPRLPIAAQLDYLVCAVSCIPYTARLTLDLPRGAASEDADVAPRLATWRARLPRSLSTPDAPRVEGRLTTTAGTDLQLDLVLRGGDLRAIAPDLYFEPHPLLSLSRPSYVATAAGPAFRVGLQPLDVSKPLPARLHFSWTAVGFEQEGAAAAWEGELELARPGPRPRAPLLLGFGAGLLLLSLFLSVVHRRRAVNAS